jgi:hypothetical protein
VNLDVILQYRLIIGNSPIFMHDDHRGLSESIIVLALLYYNYVESSMDPTTEDTDATTMATSDGNIEGCYSIINP